LPPDVIFTAKLHQFDFGWVSAPNPAGEAPRRLAGFKGSYFKGREGKMEKGGKGKGRGRLHHDCWEDGRP